MLTRKQHELLIFIDAHLKKTGFSPSFEEMKAALDLKSKSGIHRLISALEERGFLHRRHHRARALEVVRLPGDPLPAAAEAPPSNVIKGEFGPRPQPLPAPAPIADTQDNTIPLPLYGRIAAGLPIEAVADTSRQIEVPVSLLGPGEHYALEVAGDSMIEAGIFDGDTVIIRRGESAENGQIVVALIDDGDVTLKRLRRRGASIALEPANQTMKTRIFPADRVKLQGRLVALLRQYS
jgi:repressor LexA